MKQNVKDILAKVRSALVTAKDKVVGLKSKVTKESLYWLIPALIIVAGLIALVALPANDSAEQVAQTGDEPENIVAERDGMVAGTYTSGLMPAASTPGREFELALADDGRAIFTADYKTGDRLVVETGTWEETDDRITVTLVTRFGYPISEPLTLTFAKNDAGLSLVDYDYSRWGALGLTLTRGE